MAPRRQGRQERGGLLGDPHQVDAGLARSVATSEAEELPDHLGHPLRLVHDDACPLARRRPFDLTGGDHLRPLRDHVERGAELVGHPRSQLADSGQAVGVAKLADGLEARSGLGVDAPQCFRKVLAHRVDLAPELADLVALSHRERAREVAGADPAGLVHQLAHGIAHEHRPQHAGDQSGENHQDDGGGDAGRDPGADVAPAHLE